MWSKKSIILMLVSVMIFILELDAYADNSPTRIEDNIHSGSIISEIKKLQPPLKEFDTCTGEIIESYSGVELPLLNAQEWTWIIQEHSDYWAWYLDEKIILALKKDYPDKDKEVIKVDYHDKDGELIKRYLQTDIPKSNVRYFYVTAYYSPLPWQRRYTTWSYEWDVRLNWEWKHTASWKQVFAWLLAAPSNYLFWTKIEFEGLWVWEVSDRWWAIVNSWKLGYDGDRIDIWMWYWDKWLERALEWWKRKIKWKVVPSSTDLSIEFKESPVVKYGNLIVDPTNPQKEDVIKLQNLLTEVNIYTWAIDGIYNSVKEVLIKYQVENNIINSKNVPEAWYVWNKTIAALRERFGWNIFKLKNSKLVDEVFLVEEIKWKLDLLNNKISLFIEQKFWKNTPKALEYRKNLRTFIDKQTKKEKNKERKNQLDYLKSIIS